MASKGNSLRILLLGLPATGKGTVAVKLAKDFNMLHLSTGDMLRLEIQRGTEIGNQAKSLIENGKLVPDEVVNQLVRNKICDKSKKDVGFVLDGYPRTVNQAEMLLTTLDEFEMKLDGVFYFTAPEQLLMSRISGRRVHLSSGRVYNTEFMPPKVPGKDDVTGEPLIQRDDDRPEIFKRRLEESKKMLAEVKPVIETRNKGHEIVAVKGVEEVYDVILKILGLKRP